MSRTAPITVVIPTRDRWDLLERTLRSVRRQLVRPAEIIVVDDHSTIEAPESLKAGVILLRLRSPAGVAVARNIGWRAAQTEFVAFLDDDDLWAPTKLQEQQRQLAQTDTGWCFTGAVHFDAGDFRHLVEAPALDGLERSLLRNNVIPGGCSGVAVRRDLLEFEGGFDERLSLLADWDLWIRLARRATRVGRCSEPVTGYYVHERNMSGLLDVVDTELAVLRDKHAARARELGVALDEARLVRWSAWHRRRQQGRLAAAKTYVRGARRYRDPGHAVRALATLIGFRRRPSAMARRSGDRPVPTPPRPESIRWLEAALSDEALRISGSDDLLQGER